MSSGYIPRGVASEARPNATASAEGPASDRAGGQQRDPREVIGRAPDAATEDAQRRNRPFSQISGAGGAVDKGVGSREAAETPGSSSASSSGAGLYLPGPRSKGQGQGPGAVGAVGAVGAEAQGSFLAPSRRTAGVPVPRWGSLPADGGSRPSEEPPSAKHSAGAMAPPSLVSPTLVASPSPVRPAPFSLTDPGLSPAWARPGESPGKRKPLLALPAYTPSPLQMPRNPSAPLPRPLAGPASSPQPPLSSGHDGARLWKSVPQQAPAGTPTTGRPTAHSLRPEACDNGTHTASPAPAAPSSPAPSPVSLAEGQLPSLVRPQPVRPVSASPQPLSRGPASTTLLRSVISDPAPLSQQQVAVPGVPSSPAVHQSHRAPSSQTSQAPAHSLGRSQTSPGMLQTAAPLLSLPALGGGPGSAPSARALAHSVSDPTRQGPAMPPPRKPQEGIATAPAPASSRSPLPPSSMPKADDSSVKVAPPALGRADGTPTAGPAAQDGGTGAPMDSARRAMGGEAVEPTAGRELEGSGRGRDLESRGQRVEGDSGAEGEGAAPGGGAAPVPPFPEQEERGMAQGSGSEGAKASEGQQQAGTVPGTRGGPAASLPLAPPPALASTPATVAATPRAAGLAQSPLLRMSLPTKEALANPTPAHAPAPAPDPITTPTLNLVATPSPNPTITPTPIPAATPTPTTTPAPTLVLPPFFTGLPYRHPGTALAKHQRRFLELQKRLQSTEETDYQELKAALKAMKAADRSRKAANAEKRSLDMLLQEGLEMQRSQRIGVLAKRRKTAPLLPPSLSSSSWQRVGAGAPTAHPPPASDMRGRGAAPLPLAAEAETRPVLGLSLHPARPGHTGAAASQRWSPAGPAHGPLSQGDASEMGQWLSLGSSGSTGAGAGAGTGEPGASAGGAVRSGVPLSGAYQTWSGGNPGAHLSSPVPATPAPHTPAPMTPLGAPGAGGRGHLGAGPFPRLSPLGPPPAAGAGAGFAQPRLLVLPGSSAQKTPSQGPLRAPAAGPGGAAGMPMSPIAPLRLSPHADVRLLQSSPAGSGAAPPGPRGGVQPHGVAAVGSPALATTASVPKLAPGRALAGPGTVALAPASPLELGSHAGSFSASGQGTHGPMSAQDLRPSVPTVQASPGGPGPMGRPPISPGLLQLGQPAVHLGPAEGLCLTGPAVGLKAAVHGAKPGKLAPPPVPGGPFLSLGLSVTAEPRAPGESPAVLETPAKAGRGGGY